MNQKLKQNFHCTKKAHYSSQVTESENAGTLHHLFISFQNEQGYITENFHLHKTFVIIYMQINMPTYMQNRHVSSIFQNSLFFLFLFTSKTYMVAVLYTHFTSEKQLARTFENDNIGNLTVMFKASKTIYLPQFTGRFLQNRTFNCFILQVLK